MYCLDLYTGSIKWSKEIPKPVLSSPTLIRNKVIFATSNNTVYCLDSGDGKRVWEFETGDKVWSSPSLVEYDKMLFFGCLDSHIYGVNRSGNFLPWIWSIPHHVSLMAIYSCRPGMDCYMSSAYHLYLLTYADN